MELKELAEKWSSLRIDGQRACSDDYIELVFLNKDTEAWTKILTDFLGPAVKPAGRKPGSEDIQLSEDYGGIYDNQTLFKKEFGAETVLAMFWPWQDQVHTTLKVALKRK